MFNYQQKSAYSKKKFDVVLVVGSIPFAAHKSILSEKSEYFKTLFTSSSDRFELEETNAEAFDVLLLFIYSSSFYAECKNGYYTVEKCFKILACAREYQVDSLVYELTIYIQRECAKPELVGVVLNNALAFDEEDLVKNSTDWLLVIITTQRKKMDAETLFPELESVAVERILRQPLNIIETLRVYEGMVSWIQSHTEYSYLLPEFLKLIDLSSLEVKYVTQLLEPANPQGGFIQQKIRFAKSLNDKNGHLYLNKDLSDVTLVIDGTELPAHRSILSERSEYFKAMLSSSFIESNSNKITLKETNLNAFKAVLKYIYTGSIYDSENKDLFTLDETLEVLACARYCMMDDLAKETTLFIICIFQCTSLQLLKYGFKYFVDDLITYGTDLFLEMAPSKTVETLFDKLKPVIVEHLLKQPLYLKQEIYGALISWIQSNPEYSYLLPDLLKHIDLSPFDVKYVSKLLESADCGECQRKMRNVKMLNDKNSHLYLSKELSDVTLVINGTELPAHRSILSERSEYFKTILSNNVTEADSDIINFKSLNLNSDTIILNNVNVNAFKVVLKFIYTGSIYNSKAKNLSTLDETFDLLACAQYCKMDALVKEMALILICIHRCTPVRLLNFGIEYSVDDLISYSTDKIKEKMSTTTQTKLFEHMSPLSVKHVLKCRTNMQESAIFEELVAWMRANPEHSDSFPELLKDIDFYLLDEKHVLMLFQPTHLVDFTFFKDLVFQQREQAGKITKIVDKNVINGIDDLRIVDGVMSDYRSSDQSSNRAEKFVTPASSKSYITFDLKKTFLLNSLKFKISQAFYTVLVSTNMHDWERIIDYSKYDCFGPQELYFNERAIRFIRIPAVHRRSFDFDLDAGIEAFYSTNPLEVDHITTVSIPKHNLVSTNMKNHARDDSTGAFIKRTITNGYVQHLIPNGSIDFRFSQPYMIGSLKLLLNERTSYYIILKSYNSDMSANATRVFSEENVSGWRTVTFEKQPVSTISIVGTKSPFGYLRLYGFQCPAI
uniref:BTB domain-containing protein n=1 Tax=Panagrellus redivivus TaxID=6233 RepID=A0A7E4VLK6_PANRE